MVESLTRRKKKMRDLLDRLARKYGVTRLSSQEAGLELCVYLIFRQGWDYKKAAKATSAVIDEFVDLNELRVSYIREVCEVLDFLKYKDLREKAGLVIAFLKEVYEEYDCMPSDFSEMGFEEVRKFFSTIQPLGKSNAYVFLQLLKKEMDGAGAGKPQILVMSSEGLRVAIRLGVIKKTGSQNVGRKELMKLIDPSDYVRFQNFFVRHGDELCKSKAPLCQDCFLKSFCSCN